MFKFLKRLFSKPKPPTRKQIQYAEFCGLVVEKGMTRDEVSKMIDAALREDVKLKFKVNARYKKANEANEALPGEVNRQIKEWEKRLDEGHQIVAGFRDGKSITVDVLEVHDLFVDYRTHQLYITFLCPNVEDQLVGHDGENDVYEKALNWERPIELTPDDLVKYRKTTVHDDQLRKYKSQVEKMMKERRRR